NGMLDFGFVASQRRGVVQPLADELSRQQQLFGLRAPVHESSRDTKHDPVHEPPHRPTPVAVHA
ncbi:MAG TPA: hypothetical protein VE861_08955, partial [Gemmatimonadaceae bacterium]|nr:hypothetical protein [Gemmatimonadaceae bacterium]